MTATCETCRFHDMPDGGQIGTCRRHSPSRWGWGLSYPRDWCGEHEPKAVDRQLPKDLQYGAVALKRAVASATLPEIALICPVCGALENEAHKADCTVVFSGISG